MTEKRRDKIVCGKVHMFSFLFLTNLVHSLNLTVSFSWSTGEGLNWSLTLEFTIQSNSRKAKTYRYLSNINIKTSRLC